MSIARRYLIPKKKEENGLADVEMRLKNSAVRSIIQHYTRESGVRSLEREISTICRKLAKDVLKSGKEQPRIVTAKNLPKFLGIRRFRYGQVEKEDQMGLVTGLAWTEMGGELLVTEATIMPGKGKLIITGKLGEVMQESAQAAMSYVRTRAERFGIDKKFYETLDVHVHVPEGAIPKDGPSAGITMATTLISALGHIPVKKDVAMTGEITLRGRVMAIGGLKEKAMAAHRGGIKTIIIPWDNRKDVKEIPKRVREQLTIIPVEHMDEVLRHALVLENPDAFFQRADEVARREDAEHSKVSAANVGSPQPSSQPPSQSATL
jgi:ATP-dependent Lon protease